MRKNTGETMNLDQIWMDEKKLIPAVIQDKNTKDILMLGYMNKESFCKTLESYKVTFLAAQDKNYGRKERHQEII